MEHSLNNISKWLMSMALLLTVFCISLQAEPRDSTSSSKLGPIRKTVRGFSAIDTNYIEPQHYNYALMVQTTYNYDMYWLKSNTGQQVMLSPDMALRVGPYFGWR